MSLYSFFQQSLTYPAASVRKLLALIAAGDDGVLLDRPNPLLVQAQDTPDMTVTVTTGWGKKSGYLGFSSSTATVTIDTANATNPRIDLVVMRWQDTEAGDPGSSCTIEVVKGTAAASPSVPSTTGMVVQVLAQVRVNAATTTIAGSAITDKRTKVSPAVSTGDKTDGLPISAASGWSVSYTWNVTSGIMFLTIVAQRTGADLTMASDGGLANNTVATMSGSFLPLHLVPTNYVATACTGGFILDPATGNAQITDGYPTAKIETNDFVRATLMYPIGQ